MKHFLNDIEISPVNREAIALLCDFTNEEKQLQITEEKIILNREAYKQVLEHIDNIGLFEGIPYRIEFETVALEYYLDLTNSLVIDNQNVAVSLVKRKSFEDFKTKAMGTSFELMLSKNVSFDTFNVPYFVIPNNQLEQGLTLGISLFVMTTETIRAAQEVANSISELIQAVTPSVGLGVVIDTGDVIVLALKVVFRIIVFGLLVTALLNMAARMFVFLFPPKRNLLGCKFQELLSKGCQYLGYQFESDLFANEQNWTLLPVPLTRNRKSIWDFLPDEFFPPFNKGVPGASDTTPTLGQFIDALLLMFNARLFVFDNVVRIERRDWLIQQANALIEPALSIQDKRKDSREYNTDEIWKRYYIKYEIDFNDLYCADNIYDFHDAEYTTEPTSFVNADLVTIKGLNEVSIPFALGARKEKLNAIEVIGKSFFELVDLVTGLFGGGTNYGSQIGERKDCLKISQDYFSITKVLWTVNGKQPLNYINNISATALWNKYHYINAIDKNSFEIRKDVPIRIRDVDFLTLLNKNYIEVDGVNCEITNIIYNDEVHEAKITYRKPSNYATGKVSIIKLN